VLGSLKGLGVRDAQKQCPALIITDIATLGLLLRFLHKAGCIHCVQRVEALTPPCVCQDRLVACKRVYRLSLSGLNSAAMQQRFRFILNDG